MSVTNTLIVVRPGQNTAELDPLYAIDSQNRILSVPAEECYRRVPLTLRYKLQARYDFSLIVVPVSELSCITFEDGSPPAILAYGPVEHMERAFMLGVAEYVVEPFTGPELVIRSRRVLARYPFYEPINGFRETLSFGGGYRSLSPRERAVYELLARYSGRVVDRYTLAATIGFSTTRIRAGSRAVDMTISRLRRALVGSGAEIETVRGIGYRFIVDNRWINQESNADSRAILSTKADTAR